MYQLEVSEIFKGYPKPRVDIYMPHDSGAFYVAPDKDYLLFLNRIAPYRGRPTVAVGAFTVKYACGQSKLWVDVGQSTLRALRLKAFRSAH